MNHSKVALIVAFSLAFTSCSNLPSGPSVRVMPGPGKPFDQFQAENAACREFAKQQIGTEPNDATRNQMLTGAAVGTVVGAAAGALLGRGGKGAATGAGLGMLGGTAVGASGVKKTEMTFQERYDVAYGQCMYAKDNQVPGYAPPTYKLPPASPTNNTPPPPPPPPGYNATPPPPPPAH